MDLAPRPARLDVCQDAFQVANAGSQRPHFTQSLVRLFQKIADLLEGLAEPGFQCTLKLFVHGLSHLIELLFVLRLDGREASVYRRPNASKFCLLQLHHLADGFHGGVAEILQRASGVVPEMFGVFT